MKGRKTWGKNRGKVGRVRKMSNGESALKEKGVDSLHLL